MTMMTVIETTNNSGDYAQRVATGGSSKSSGAGCGTAD